MELARISAKGQVTIPRNVRATARLAEGDVLTFVVEHDRIILRKLPSSDAYLQGVEASLAEWNTAEDESAWRDL